MDLLFPPTPAPALTVSVGTLLACMAIACLGVVAYNSHKTRRLQEETLRFATNAMLFVVAGEFVTRFTDKMEQKTDRSVSDKLMECFKGAHATNAHVDLHTVLRQLIRDENDAVSTKR